MIRVEVTADAEDATGFLVRVEGGLADRRALNNVLAQTLADELKDHFRALNKRPNKMGAEKTNFWNEVAESIGVPEVTAARERTGRAPAHSRETFCRAGCFTREAVSSAERANQMIPMKTNTLSVILTGLLWPAAGFAKPPGMPDDGPAKGGRGPEKRHAPERWKTADADGDGFLSFEEFSSLPKPKNLDEDKRRKIFDRFDKNNDGKIGPGEMGPGKEGGPPFRLLWELDTDKSGGISLEEFRAGGAVSKLPVERQEQIFKRLDKDGDGQITPKDRPEHPPGGEGGKGFDLRRLVGQLDENKDGAVDFEEFRKSPMAKNLTEEEQKRRFGRLDRNHDGKLTADDFPQPPRGGTGPGEGRRPHPWRLLLPLDENKDGAVDFAEFRKGPMVKGLTEDEQEERFQELDQNKDGKLTPQDFPPPPPPKPPGPRDGPVREEMGPGGE